MKKIKLTVSTGWANGDHVDYVDLPIHWDQLSDKGKEDWIHEAAGEYLHECCESFGELIEDEDEE